MSTLSQRKDGRWLVKYKQEGVWKQKCFREAAEAEARRFLEETSAIEAQVKAEEKAQKEAEPEVPEEYRVTLGELVVRYFQANERSLGTRRHLIYCLCGYEHKGKHVKGDGEFLRDKPAMELSRHDLEKLRDSFRTRKVGNNAINHYQAQIRAVLAWAADQELIPVNPWREYKRLPVKKKLITVNLDDFRRIYNASPAWLQWALKTAFCLCLRPGIVELFRLKWTNFRWNSGTVQLIQGKTGSIKTVYPPKQYLQEAWQRYQADLANGIEYVCTRDGGRVVHAYNKDWEKVCKAAGVKMRPYDIRHLAASEMLAGGADLAAVAAQLGHSNVATTGKTYAHVVPAAQTRAAGLLPAL